MLMTAPNVVSDIINDISMGVAPAVPQGLDTNRQHEP